MRIAVVGAGPVGVGLAERLLANAGELIGDLACEIVLIDPCPPGAGRVWRTDQSPLMRMNSLARDVTLFPGESVRCDGPARPGPALDEWAAATAAGLLPPLPDPRLAEDLREVAPGTFATRRLQGEYLSWFLGHVTAHAPSSVRVGCRTGRAIDLIEGPDGTQSVRLADGTRIEADAVVLALGHLDARPGGGHAEPAAFAAENGLLYLRPVTPPTSTCPASRPTRTSSCAASAWRSSTSWHCSPRDVAAGTPARPTEPSATCPAGENPGCTSGRGAGCPTGASPRTR